MRILSSHLLHGKYVGLFFRPEFRLDSELVHFLNQHADIVAEDFADHFVLHRHVRLAANVVAELGFQHAERALDVAPLVVMGKEIVLTKSEVVEVHCKPFFS